MSDLNSWAITGRLTRDADYRVLASGKPLLTCSVAVNTGWGEYKKTVFVKVQQWGERGANLKPYLTKGKLIGVSGSLSVNVWQGKDGVEHNDLVIDTSSIQLLGGAGEERKERPEPRPPEPESIDDIPF